MKLLGIKKDTVILVLYLCMGLAIGYSAKFLYSWYNTPPLFLDIETSSHFESTSEKVVLYSTKWCPACKKTREFFAKHDISYIDRDIESSDDEINMLFSSIQEPGVPKIVIESGVINGYVPELILEKIK